jgi:hypothetical protein
MLKGSIMKDFLKDFGSACVLAETPLSGLAM